MTARGERPRAGEDVAVVLRVVGTGSNAVRVGLGSTRRWGYDGSGDLGTSSPSALIDFAVAQPTKSS